MIQIETILDILVKGFVIGIVVSAPLGPVGVLCIQRTLNKGLGLRLHRLGLRLRLGSGLGCFHLHGGQQIRQRIIFFDFLFHLMERQAELAGLRAEEPEQPLAAFFQRFHGNIGDGGVQGVQAVLQGLFVVFASSFVGFHDCSPITSTNRYYFSEPVFLLGLAASRASLRSRYILMPLVCTMAITFEATQ